MHPYKMRCLKLLTIRKNSVEQKYEWNLSVLWLFLATVAYYLSCLESVVLAHPFWALPTFLVFFFSLSLALGQIELIWVKIILSDLKKISILIKQHTHCIMTILCQGNFWEQRAKLSRPTLNHQELLKKR